jgi:hypothetical protein
MGLDMYLKGKRYLSKYFNEGDAELAAKIQEMLPELEGRSGHFGDDAAVKQIEIEAGYWRKANAIHDWFVKNCQGGTDDCGNYYVAREQLQELKELCEQVLANRAKAAELLPTTSGFFFGSTEYDDWYYQDIESTIQIIDAALELPKQWEFEYHSSW